MPSPFLCTDQVGGEVNKVSIVLIDELHHGRFQQLIVELQVLPHLLQLDLLPTLRHKLVNIEVILQAERQQTAKSDRLEDTDTSSNVITNTEIQAV